MQFANLLKPGAVRVLAHQTSKKRLFHDLGDIAQDVYDIDAQAALDALQERENLGPTGVGQGVALPHARIPAIDTVRGVFVRLERAIDFDSVDRQPVDLVFALFAPGGTGVDHLKALALVSRTLRNQGVCEKLRANDAPETLYAVLTEAQDSQAA